MFRIEKNTNLREIYTITVGIIVGVEESGGGVYQYTQSLIAALKEDKTRKYILFCLPDDKIFINYGLEIRRYKKQKSGVFIKIIRLFQCLLFIRRSFLISDQEINLFLDVDVWISPAISLYPHFYLSKPYIFTLHDMQEKYYPEFFSKKELFMRWLVNRTLTHCADKIVCESKYVKDDIVKFTKTQQSKIAVIQSPPPVELQNIILSTYGYERIKQKYNLPEKFIYYPAQCWPHKNHIRLIEAFKIVSQQYPDVFLILSGSEQNNYKKVMKKIENYNIETKIKHLGYIDYDDIPYVYKLAHILVMPTLFESVSIPVYEAFALGTPVCCSNAVALPEQVGDAGLLFNPFDVSDIANKILMYLNDEKLRQEKIKLGNCRVTGFDHLLYKEKLNDLLLKIG